MQSPFEQAWLAGLLAARAASPLRGGLRRSRPYRPGHPGRVPASAARTGVRRPVRSALSVVPRSSSFFGPQSWTKAVGWRQCWAWEASGRRSWPPSWLRRWRPASGACTGAACATRRPPAEPRRGQVDHAQRYKNRPAPLQPQWATMSISTNCWPRWLARRCWRRGPKSSVRPVCDASVRTRQISLMRSSLEYAEIKRTRIAADVRLRGTRFSIATTVQESVRYGGCIDHASRADCRCADPRRS